MLIDSFERQINYLRISVTDRCNLRCAYCMPVGKIRWLPRPEILSKEEILQVVRSAADLGVSKIRLTGGEPLTRPDLVELVRDIKHVSGIQDISLTTNGMLLERFAGPLAEAGLSRVNISLDSLDPIKFRRITHFGELDRVWEGLLAAERAGLTPIKINMVVVRGVNEDEILDFANLTKEHAWQVRFIELMPVGNSGDWGIGFPAVPDRYYSVQEMMEILSAQKLEPVQNKVGSGPARTYRIPNAPGIIGLISPLGEHFCETCNRIRLTADGKLRPCLLSNLEISLKDALNRGDDLQSLIRSAVFQKPYGHTLTQKHPVKTQNRLMWQIGG
jgi:cyclic pyranopterin phosphate synthase